MLKFLCVSLSPPPSPLDRHRLHGQKHLGRPSSLLGGVAKGSPGSALRTRCAFFGGRRKQRGYFHWPQEEKREFAQGSRESGESCKSVVETCAETVL